MSAIIILGAMVLWGLPWLFVWYLITRPFPGVVVRAGAGVLLFAGWLLVPWVDQWLGAREFERRCSAMPEVEWFGPVAVGEGPFYTADGTPKWETPKQLEKISQPIWDQLFRSVEVTRKHDDAIFPIVERRISMVYQPTGEVVTVLTDMWSPGGWLMRKTGFGAHAPLQCPWKGYVVRPTSDLITFKK